MTLNEAIRELYFWQHGNGDNFHSLLYTLIGKADPHNQRQLEMGFPNEVLAWQMWQNAKNPEAFFKYHGIPGD